MPLGVRGAIFALSILVLFCSALVDLPRAIQVGPVTAQAILTIVYFIGGVFLLCVSPSLPGENLILLPVLLFTSWAALSLIWTTAPSNGAQNVLAIGTLVVMILLGRAAASLDPEFGFWLERQLRRSAALAILIYTASVLWFGAGSDDIVSARVFGLFALFGVVTQLARWRNGESMGLLWASLITVLIGISESRLALGIGVALFPLAQMPTRKAKKLLKTITVSVVALALSTAAFLYSDALRQRFLTGDTSLKIGSIAINGSGRAAFWKSTVASFEEAPVVGKGAGSAEGLIEALYGEIRHPHSDYLRIAHDYGLIGLAAWATALLTLMIALWSNWREADGTLWGDARLQLGALLALISFALQMTAENALVYVVISAPLGLFVGSALGLHRARRFAASSAEMASRTATYAGARRGYKVAYR